MRPKNPLLTLTILLFAYALFTNVNVAIQLISDHKLSAAEIDDTPALDAWQSPAIEGGRVSYKGKVPDISMSAPATSKNFEDGIGDVLDIKRLAKILTRSFSVENGIPIDDQLGFDLTFINLNSPTHSTCNCDVVSIDCLNTIACLPRNPQYRNALVWIGLEMRRAIKAASIFDGKIFAEPKLPLGKSLQYSTIEVWEYWRKHNILPDKFDANSESIFVEETWYPDCNVEFRKYYRGSSCFYQGLKASEDLEGAVVENEAIQWVNDVMKNDTDKRRIRKLLKKFVVYHQPYLKKAETGDFRNFADVAQTERQLSPLGSLLMFAHMVRMMFNRRPFLDKIYQEKLASVGRDGYESLSSSKNVGTTSSMNKHNEPFNVALHIRRGDSCGDTKPSEYEISASELDSPAQTGSDRKCYKTNVYVDVLSQIRRLVPKTRPLHVYLATDDVGDLLDEILNKKVKDRKDSSAEEEIDVEHWHFLNYSRHYFDYNADSIEAEENSANQPILGETAVVDLWHLSHGHVFVGHLGSRFGKVAWLLATARQNFFVPFYTVDGHSFCCEIDEACGRMKPFVTVDNCLTFGHEYARFDHDRNNGTYWAEGSLARKTIFLERQKEKNEGKK